jgi:chemotaxis protein MotB
MRRRVADGAGLNAWPGYVDALSTLLMVIIFVLLVFVLAQAFLSVALSGRDRALDRLNRQMAQLSDMLSLERGRSAELRVSLAQVNRDLQATTSTRDTLAQQLAALQAEQDKLMVDRDALRTERNQLSARLADAAVQMRAAQSRTEDLSAQLAEAARRTDVQGQETAATAAQLAEARRQLAARGAEVDVLRRQLAEAAGRADTTAQNLSANQKALADTRTELASRLADLAAARQQIQAAQAQLDEMHRQIAELNQARQVDRATVEARIADLANMANQVRALTALRDDLEKQAREAAARAVTEAQARAVAAQQAEEEKRLGDSARAQLALVSRQIDELRAQLGAVQKALDIAEVSARDKDVQITNLGSRLNAALAQKVEELQGYRSEFFGRLRQVLANRPGIQVVGDRFVFQSEVLFPVGSADLTSAGADQMDKLADTLKQVSTEIPEDIPWILRVDGHADRQHVAENGRWGSNWELSAGRAITVVKVLIADGIPPTRLAATGFADNQPLDPADTLEAYGKNRRIEIRLTDR